MSFPPVQENCTHCGIEVPPNQPGRCVEVQTGKVWCCTEHALGLEVEPPPT